MLKGTGGWLTSSAQELVKRENITLYIASVSNLVNKLTMLVGDSGINYFLIPIGHGNTDYNHEYEAYWKEIINKINPDIIHLHGTEFSHGLACLNVCGDIKFVVTMQGVMQEISKNYLGGLTLPRIIRNVTIYDILNGGIIRNARVSKKRAEIEMEILRKVHYVIGKTDFDREQVLKINSSIKYFRCNNVLRDVFYENDKWQYSKCCPCSIFVSSSHYPLKGLHKLLEALPDVLKIYPNTRLRVAGRDMLKSDFLHQTGYEKIIGNMINKYQLRKVVSFIGKLDSEAMKKEYLNSNVFICTSSNENSSNSISEAQILGVPIIASNVGGNPCFIVSEEDGFLYNFGDVKSLSLMICEVFDHSQFFDNSHMIHIAKERHNKKRHLEDLLNAYHMIYAE